MISNLLSFIYDSVAILPYMVYFYLLSLFNLILIYNISFIYGCVVGFGLAFILFIASSWSMPGVRCPNCSRQGVEQWVLPGKHCPKCAHPC